MLVWSILVHASQVASVPAFVRHKNNAAIVSPFHRKFQRDSDTHNRTYAK